MIMKWASPELVDADGLDRWADDVDSIHILHEILQILLRETPGVTGPPIRAGKGVFSGGFDATVKSREPYGNYVPAGESGWELSTDKKILEKAQSDYGKRTEDPCGMNPSKTAFVFVTPRRWDGKDKWAKARSDEGRWREVRALDADDLAAWLASRYAAHVLVSEKLGRSPQEAESLGRWWLRWAGRTKPETSADLLLAGRRAEAQELREMLGGSPQIIGVKAGSKEEALAFIVAALIETTDDSSAPITAAVVTSLDVWNRCTLSAKKDILIPCFREIDQIEVAQKSYYALVPLGAASLVGESGEIICLPKVGLQEAREALIGAGVPHDKALRYASIARRSLLSLRRIMSAAPEVAAPGWADSEDAGILAPLALVGSWDQDNDLDLWCVEEITGCDSEDIERRLLRWEKSDDPLFRCSGGIWRLSSPTDAWKILGGMITRDCMRRWSDITLAVLSVLDPLYGVRFTVNSPGAARNCSPELREGLAQGAAMLAAFGLPQHIDKMDGRGHSGRVVLELLDKAGGDPAAQLWRSLSDVLPLLAEAAPDVVLNAVRRDATGATPPLAAMFTDSSHYYSNHVGLINALEVLCWSENHFSSALDELLRLSEIDPGGPQSNRPLNSANSVLMPGLTQTGAPLERRLDVLDGLVRRHGQKGWELLLSLITGFKGLYLSTSKPRFRDWADVRHPNELAEEVKRVTIQTLAKAEGDPSRLSQIIDCLLLMNAETQRWVVEHLSGLDAGDLGGAGQLTVWKSLNNLVGGQRNRESLQKRLPDEVFERLDALYNSMKPPIPETLIYEYRWLFTWHPESPIHELQDAVRRIYQALGIDGLVSLVKEIGSPGMFVPRSVMVGVVAADIGINLDIDDILALMSRNKEEAWVLVQSWIGRRAEKEGSAWVEEIAKSLEGSPDLFRAKLFLAVRSDADNLGVLYRMPSAVQDQYWQRINTNLIVDGDFRLGFEKLLDYDRPWVALDALYMQLCLDRQAEEADRLVTVELAERVLLRLSDDVQQKSFSGMTGHYALGEVIDYIDEQNPESDTLAEIELALSPLLIWSEHSPKAIHRRLQTDPAEFVKLIRKAYRSANGESETDPNDTDIDISSKTAYRILKRWRTLPGYDPDTGRLDLDTLRAWVAESRRQLKSCDREQVGDICIGEMLSGSPDGKDGIWPAEEVRDLLEELENDKIERGLSVGHFNKRGVTVRALSEGGDQERKLAEQYEQWAQQVESKWPRTGRLLRERAGQYEREARWQDADADADADQF